MTGWRESDAAAPARWPRGRRIGAPVTTLVMATLAAALGPGCAAGQEDTAADVSPVGVWYYAGGDDMRMIFAEDGRLRFEGGFEFYNPASWELTLSGSRAFLALHSPGFTPDVLNLFRRRAESGLAISPDSVDAAAKTVYYDLSENPCRIDLANWFFERRSGPCAPGSEPGGPGGAGTAREPR